MKHTVSSSRDKPTHANSMVQTSQSFTRRQLLLFFFFSVTNIFSGVAYSLMAPFYPAVAESKGLTSSEYGMVFGIFQLVIFLSSPLIGKYLHILGARRTYLAGILTTGIATSFFGGLDAITDKTEFLALSFLIRIIAALGESAVSTASFSIVAVEYPNYVATTFASLETFFGLGLIIGPTLGGIFYEVGGFKVPFLFTGVSLTILGFVVCIAMPVDAPNGFHEKAPGVFAVLKTPSVCLAVVSILAASSSLGFLSATLEPHIRQFALTPMQTGLVFIIQGVAYALSAPIWGWLCDKLMKPILLALLGESLIFVGFLLIGPAPLLPFRTLLWPTCTGLIIFGIGFGATAVSSFIWALRGAVGNGFPDNVQTYGVLTALWKSSFALGCFIGPSLGGVLLDHFGFRWASTSVLGTQLAVLILFFVFSTKQRSSQVKDVHDTYPLLSDSSSPGSPSVRK